MILDDNLLFIFHQQSSLDDHNHISGKISESQKIQERLKGFDPSKSQVMKILNYNFSTGITHNELTSLARIICMYTHLKLDRLAVRDHRVLVKWFEENWATISNIIYSIKSLDENKVPITLEREIRERFNRK